MKKKRCYKGVQAATLQRSLGTKGKTRFLDRNSDGSDTHLHEGMEQPTPKSAKALPVRGPSGEAQHLKKATPHRGVPPS
jgi:hypothetical protein